MKTYQSESFNDLVFKLTELFVTLPPPPASVTSYDRCGSGGSRGGHTRGMPMVTMHSIMDYNNGCILASCRVRTHDGQNKMIAHLRRGDTLANGARVKCVVVSQYKGPLVKIGPSLVITPYHPVKIDCQSEKWSFPIDLATADDVIDVIKPVIVCNLVLDSVHAVNVAGVECVTLAHGFECDDVVKHAYYGTRRVIDDLERLDGWQTGFIVLDEFRVSRDENGRVNASFDHIYPTNRVFELKSF